MYGQVWCNCSDRSMISYDEKGTKRLIINKNMWFRLLVVLLFIGMLAPVSTMAQQTDRHATNETRSQIEQQSRREAGAMKRAGWKVMPNKMSLERQVRNVCFMEVEVLEQSGEKRYLIGSSSASDGSYLQARGKADLSAREKMVRQLVALILGESTDSNDLQDSTHSSDRAVNYKEIGPEYLQLAVPVLECYRMGRDGLYEVMVVIKADYARSLQAVKAILQRK